jgi:predicted CXXCH cytochrome family protein
MMGMILGGGLVTQVQASPYEAEVKPLTTAECGACHFSYFQAIKNEGGKHQIDCVACHKVFHAYNPIKDNYAQLMPKCAACHVSASGGPYHGEDAVLIPCLSCHANPHTPLNIPMGDIEAACGLCHAPQNMEIQNFPSKHTTDVSCADCHHDKHGLIPTCDECHENHSPAVQMDSAACQSCHPVHKPTEISYMKETDSQICAGCHDDVYAMLQRNQTKHTFVTCADCHPAHAEIPLCSRCHGEPHPQMKVDTTKCGQCHGIAHDLEQ